MLQNNQLSHGQTGDAAKWLGLTQANTGCCKMVRSHTGKHRMLQNGYVSHWQTGDAVKWLGLTQANTGDAVKWLGLTQANTGCCKIIRSHMGKHG
jgi:hypothetical protein